MHTKLTKNASQSQKNIADNKSVKKIKNKVEITVDWMDMEVLWRSLDLHLTLKDEQKLKRLVVLIVIKKTEFNTKGLRQKNNQMKNL